MKLRAPFDLSIQPKCPVCLDRVPSLTSMGCCPDCEAADLNQEPWNMPPVCRHCGRTNTPLGVCDRCYVRYYESATA